MEIIFLGTNGWYDTEIGNTPCILLKTGNFYIVFDAGNGLHKLDRYIAKDKPIYILLSHFHLDHIEGLHVLAKFRFKKGLFICGPEGTKKTLDRIIRKPFTVPLKKLPYHTAVFELPEQAKNLPSEQGGVDRPPQADERLKIKALSLEHSTLVLGYRLEIEDKTITYCTDTGYCENAVKLAKNADLLITECSYRTGEQNSRWSHLNPETAAGLAKKAGAKKLALTHFDPSRYPGRQDRIAAQKKARTVFKNSFTAFDGMKIGIS
ncbi:MAG: ribonuclease Z [Elusimicrobia bacterium]|nr:ribonuclease Z [Elusimicrobiota bacterium]